MMIIDKNSRYSNGWVFFTFHDQGLRQLLKHEQHRCLGLIIACMQESSYINIGIEIGIKELTYALVPRYKKM